MRVCLFEDAAVAEWEPLTLTRPAFALLSGCGSLADKHFHFFGATAPGAIVRASVAPLLSEAFAVNDVSWLRAGPLVLVNARWLPLSASPPDRTQSHVGLVDNEVAYAVIGPELVSELQPETLADQLDDWREHLPARPAGGRILGHLWDLVDANAESLVADAPLSESTPEAEILCIGPRERLSIAASAVIEPQVVADTTKGPVIVDHAAHISAFSRLEGPCYIGPSTQVMGAKIRGGTSLGPGCRIGGEVECSIVQGFSNKYHDGFLGHAYVGSWVNLGAGTSNSDLRNDYGPVRVMVNDRLVDTGRTKVGCFLGDHVKAAIGCLLNTGTSVGPFAGLLPSGSLLPRQVPAFCNVLDGRVVTSEDVDSLIATARIVMSRRDRVLTPAHEQLYRAIYEQTAWSRTRTTHEQERRRVRVGA
jgi:UDP-N-acetylglucosamine diphosphorylase/glucosamine-1-phosphate N-acetyltransferase